MCQIEILLSTFNGASYLPALLSSLENQSFVDWRLLARDDGSEDDSASILRTFAGRCPAFELLEDAAEGHVGVVESFNRLLQRSTSPYVMFCDQDDVWLPKKIGLTYTWLRSRESSPSVPVLAFTDLEVVDSTLHRISPSYIEMHDIAPNLAGNPYYVAYRNPAVGCTIMMNRAAVGMAADIDKGALMHDWWSVIACAMSGVVVFVPYATVLYRQHAGNVVGARPTLRHRPTRYVANILRSTRWLTTVIEAHRRHLVQAKLVSRKLNCPFSTILYWVHFFLGRVLCPVLGWVPQFGRHTWRHNPKLVAEQAKRIARSRAPSQVDSNLP